MAIVDHGQFFSREELQCRCGECGYLCKMDEAFMLYLGELREKFNKPLYLSSGFRCHAHNRKVSSSGSSNGPHTTGKAADILIAKQDGYEILKLALELGFSGIGINQKGAGRFIHLDTLTRHEGFRPTIWSY